MTIAEMRARKIELGLTSQMIAEAAGVPKSTVQKLFSGATKAPRKSTIDAIERVLRNPGEKKSDTRHTIDDYYALPEDQRVELIDGVFYDMGAPALMHQSILGDLHILFRECADRHGMPCEVYLSPCDVRLDMDNYTMVQPDLLVICREYDLSAIRFEGAPDLVVEILSPSSRSKDMLLKLYKYHNAGVREYWIVDPKYRTVTVHYFETEDYDPKKYSFDDIIPIEISKGECSIDFSRISKRLAGFEK